MFHGNDFDKWAVHFEIGAEFKQQLVILGVRNVDDLSDVFDDVDILRELQVNNSREEFKKFRQTAAATAVLNVIALPAKTKMILNVEQITTNSNKKQVRMKQYGKKPTKLNSKQGSFKPQKPHYKYEPDLIEVRLQAIQIEIRRVESGAEAQESQDMAPTNEVDDARERNLLERLAETKKRSKLIAALQAQLRETASLDLVIALDCTDSMESYIDAAKNNIRQVADSLTRLYPDVPLRVAFIGYRDHCDGSARLEVMRFTTNMEEFKTFVGKMVAKGGGDTPEDVFGALRVAETMEWRSATRILCHIADAPCHGTPEFHDYDDSHPGGDPHGLKADKLLKGLKDQRVQYYFGKITDYTDKMITRFNQIMGGTVPFVTTTPITASTLMSVVSSSVSSSLTPTLSTTARAGGETHKMTDVVGHRYHLRNTVSQADLLAMVSDVCLENFPDSALANIKIAPQPFAKGAMKAAFYGYDCTARQPVVFKQSMAAKESQRSLAKYEAFLVCHYAAHYFALEFNKIKPTYLRAREGQPYFLQEEQLVGTFEKFNNNAGYCQPSPTAHGTEHNPVQAFSHWTHHVTGGALMVVDCQGIYDAASKTFKLTDPAVHCTTLTRFGGTNLGKMPALRAAGSE
eukprot:gene39414-48708_t